MAGYSEVEPVKNEKGVWYHTLFEECPMCGRGREYRTRKPGPKPEDWRDRYEYVQYWDYCDAL